MIRVCGSDVPDFQMSYRAVEHDRIGSERMPCINRTLVRRDTPCWFLMYPVLRILSHEADIIIITACFRFVQPVDEQDRIPGCAPELLLKFPLPDEGRPHMIMDVTVSQVVHHVVRVIIHLADSVVRAALVDFPVFEIPQGNVVGVPGVAVAVCPQNIIVVIQDI